jgi:hypothetical protein
MHVAEVAIDDDDVYETVEISFKLNARELGHW